ncbi:MAG TPA: serine protease [Flavitalea sp.]|nr:serine protease [Flavitalea sp.]
MEDIQLLDAVERYIRNEMEAEEKIRFEQLRKSTPEIDQLVVEHTLFLQQMNQYADQKNFKSSLQEVHHDLVASGVVAPEHAKPVVIQLWKRYKRVMAVAASIAGVTTMLIAGMVSYYSRKANTAELEMLNRKFENTKRTVDALKQKVENSTPVIVPKAPINAPVISGGTGFLIDGKGYLVTNAHVVKGSTSIVVQNNKGQEFRARIIHNNPANDIAFLKIEDDDFKPVGSLPYGFRKTGADLGETLFTLGYPREEIVYNEGYMSAKTGFNGDTMTCQIGVSANPGNSGGPVFNKNGEVIGIINTRHIASQGVVFAITAKNIYRSLDEIKQDTSLSAIKLSSFSSVRNFDRVQQIKKIEDCVYMVKSY